MKEIQPVSIWYNGSMLPATIFNMYSINDNLVDTAIFYYQLFSATNQQLADGNLTLTGFDYDAYSSSIDSNSYAYQWGAAQLKLTLI
jgi:hypothetical protein